MVTNLVIFIIVSVLKTHKTIYLVPFRLIEKQLIAPNKTTHRTMH